MQQNTQSQAPRWFMIVAVLALLWNLMGVWTYIAHVSMTEEALAAMTTEIRDLYVAFPAWATGAYAIAVFSGALASVGLLLKKRWATPLFVVSLLCVLAQNVYWLFMSNAPAVYGTAVYVMPALVIAVGAALVWLSHTAAQKGWLT